MCIKLSKLTYGHVTSQCCNSEVFSSILQDYSMVVKTDCI